MKGQIVTTDTDTRKHNRSREINGATVVFKDEYDNSMREARRTTRIHVDVPNLEDVIKERFDLEHPTSYDGCTIARDRTAAAGHDKKTCEMCKLDAAWRKYNRAELTIMREKLDAWMTANGFADVKIRFSRHAGCSCPCSPGFVADRTIRIADTDFQKIDRKYDDDYRLISAELVTVTETRRVSSIHI